MKEFFTALFCITFLFPQSSPVGVDPVAVSTTSVTLNDLTPREVETLNGVNFRYFLTTISEIENVYRNGGTLDSRKLMVGALKGALQYGSGDRYSEFIPSEEIKRYVSRFFNSERMAPDGTMKEDILVGWKPLDDNWCAYLRISDFRAPVLGQMDKIIRELVIMKPRGLVIDLRNNGGGMTNVLFDVLSYFIPQGRVVSKMQFYKEPIVDVYPGRDFANRARKNIDPTPGFEVLHNIPIVILMNGYTASASEMMIAALRDASNAKLVGKKSFGKGIFQSHIASPLGMSKLTTGKWFTSKGLSIHGIGLEPDFRVEDTRNKNRSQDAQLDKAIDVLRQELKNR